MQNQKARKVKVNEHLFHINHIGGRLRHMHLSETYIEQGRQMHAANRHNEPCLLLKISSKPVHGPPLNRGQIKAGGKQHNKQHHRKKCPENIFQRTFHSFAALFIQVTKVRKTLHSATQNNKFCVKEEYINTYVAL